MKKTLQLVATACALAGVAACGGKEAPRQQFLDEIADTDIVPARTADGLYGYVDKDGNQAIGARFGAADYFHEGLALVADTAGTCGYIDRKGDYAIRPEYAEATVFNEGLAWVAEKDSALKAIDTKGNLKFRLPQAVRADIFMGGYASFIKADRTAGLVGKDGVEVALPDSCMLVEYKGDGYFAFTLADYNYRIGRVQDGALKETEVKTSFEVDNFSPEYGLLRIRDDEGKLGLCDLEGRIVVNPRYKRLHFDGKGLILFMNDKEKMGWLDTKGEEVIAARYKEVISGPDGMAFGTGDYAVVSTSGSKCQVIDRKGEVLLSAKYDKLMRSYSPGVLLCFKKDEGAGLVSPDGEVLCQPQFKDITFLAKGLFMATTDGDKWGVISDRGTFLGAVDYATPGGPVRVKVQAESRLFDLNYVETIVGQMIAQADFSTNMPALASKYSVLKSEASRRPDEVPLQMKFYTNLGMDISLRVALSASPVVSTSYWSSRREFNKNARPVAYLIKVNFDSTDKCVKAFDYLKTHNEWVTMGSADNQTSFDINVISNGDIVLLGEEVYDEGDGMDEYTEDENVEQTSIQ